MLLFVLPATVLVGCDEDDEEVVLDNADVMVVHASPDAPGVDLLVNDTKVNTAPLTYPNNTGYLNVPSGTQNIKVNAAGTSTTVIEADLELEPDGDYTVFAINTLSDIAVQGGPVLFSNRSFKSATDFTPVSAGTYTLEVRPAGSTTAVLTLPDVTLTDDAIYTVLQKASWHRLQAI